MPYFTMVLLKAIVFITDHVFVIRLQDFGHLKEAVSYCGYPGSDCHGHRSCSGGRQEDPSDPEMCFIQSLLQQT